MLNNLLQIITTPYRRMDDIKLKQFKLIGISLFIIIYFLLIYGLAIKKDTIKDSIASEKQSIIWIQQWSGFVKQQAQTVNHLNRSLSISDIELSLEKMQLKQYVSSFKQTDQHTIDLAFKSVNFNQIYIWLLNLSKKGYISIDNLTVLNRRQGLVDIDLIVNLAR